MIIDNASAISRMKKDIEYFYYDLVDLKCKSDSIAIFSNSIDDLTKHSFVTVSINDDEVIIEIHTNSISLISEAISYAKEKSDLPILLSLEKDIDISFLTNAFSIEASDDEDNKNWGIFGAVAVSHKTSKNGILVSCPSQNDIEFISTLPDREWVFLPKRIKFIKNILIAKKSNELAGYLVYDSIEAGHYDIAMVYSHPNYRRMGVASALIEHLAAECNGILYYVCANSASSARLAESLNIKQVRKETVIYKLK